MKRLVEFEIAAGGSVVVEVEEPLPPGGAVRAGREDALPEKAALTFEAALRRVRPAAEAIVGVLRDLSDPPDQVGVEFGLKLNGAMGAIVASAGIEANYKVTLTWKRSAG